MNGIGPYLRGYREERGLSQGQLAAKLGMAGQDLSAIENGRRGVSPERAARWGQVLGRHRELVEAALQDTVTRAGLVYRVRLDYGRSEKCED